jgi:hypothetical protein
MCLLLQVKIKLINSLSMRVSKIADDRDDTPAFILPYG